VVLVSTSRTPAYIGPASVSNVAANLNRFEFTISPVDRNRAMKTFYLKKKVLTRLLSGPVAEASAARLKEWAQEFPKVDKKLLPGVASLFPATSAKTFARWVAIRSPITPEWEKSEPLLRAEPGRTTILPIRDKGIWKFRKTIERLHWTADEVDLSEDTNDRKKVSDAEFGLIKQTLGWFGPADESVMVGLDEVALKKLPQKEAQFYLRAQSDQECVHSEAYSLQIQEVIPNNEREEVMNAAKNNPLVAQVADWIRWWVVAEHPAADFFAAMAFVEGVLFSGFFATLQFFKTKGLFPGITTLNEFISRDEGVHTLFWCFLLTKRLKFRPSAEAVQSIARETVRLSRRFFKRALPQPVVGLNAKLLGQYVQYVADTVLARTNYSPIYKVPNPFKFMDAMALNEVAKSNFFELQTTQYQNLGKGSLEFTIDTSPLRGD
jgi:ribonucleotide reductase beta subunit family protein with ferritin-like domain